MRETPTEWRIRDSGFPAIDRLLRRPAFQYGDDWEPLFVAAMREAFGHHLAGSPEFRGLAQQAGVGAGDLRSLRDVERMPWTFIQSMKEHELLSVPREEIVLTLTSSGTSGMKTRTCLDATSINRVRAAGYAVYRDLGILEGADHERSNYLLFTYDIERAPDLGTAWSDVMIADMAPAAEMDFLIREQEGRGFAFDLERALAAYARMATSGQPLRLLGFPAFMFHTLLEVERRGLPRLPEPLRARSWVLTGGGWKNHKGEIIGRQEFARFIERISGIPARNVRDLFGLSEHGVGYVDCEAGRLHVPVYAHAVTRDVYTLELQPPGRPGMLQLFSPILRTVPTLSLLTTDQVVLDDRPCACGRPGMGLEYVGRLGLTQYEGCAIRALDYLKVA